MRSTSCFPSLAAAFLLALACASTAQAAFVTRCEVQAQDALRRINAARARGQRCGWRSMAPAPALHWDATLQEAAAGHSHDMARRN